MSAAPYRRGEFPALDKSLDEQLGQTVSSALPFTDLQGVEVLMPRDMAEQIVEVAAGKTPADWVTWTQYGAALFIVGRPEEGIAACRRAIEVNRCSTTFFQLACILEGIGRFDEALAIMEEAAVLDGNSKFLGVMHSQALLRQGRWREGWALWQRHMWDFSHQMAMPLWRGESLFGKKILVWPDGGYGDNIMFFRWFKDLKEAGAWVAYACPPNLGTLLEHHPWLDRIFPLPEWENMQFIPKVEIDEPFDYYVPIMQLAARFNATVEGVEHDGRCPYIMVPQSGSARFSWTRRANDAHLRVGLCWKALERFESVVKRTIPREQVEKLLDVDVEWLNLQYGTRLDDPRCLEFKMPIGDWEDTADAMAELDVVVTVDTGVAHLAGAMGKPCIAVLDRGSDWKWLTKRDTSPLYPSMRLVRCKEAGMTDVVAGVVEVLADYSFFDP